MLIVNTIELDIMVILKTMRGDVIDDQILLSIAVD